MLTRRQLLEIGALGIAVPVIGCRSKGDAGLSPSTARIRDVRIRIDGEPTIEGAGVHLRRSLGGRALPLVDPFLMLDEFHSDNPEDYVKGFPSHPHRGFETVTYMIDGAMAHRDSLGNKGRLGPGSTQWMTAGRGIIHSEMPEQENGLMWGFQLWVNLPAAQKMIKPRYQDLAPASIETIALGDASVRLVAGEAGGHKGPVEGIVTAPQMLDVKLPAGRVFQHGVPSTHNAFMYVFEGAVFVGPNRTRVARGQLAVLGDGDTAAFAADEPSRFLLLAGKPINEPIARRGPFVMNTDAEIRQAIDDYNTGKLVAG